MSWVRKIEGVLDAESRVRGLWAQANAWTCWRAGNVGAGGMVRGAEVDGSQGLEHCFRLVPNDRFTGTSSCNCNSETLVALVVRFFVTLCKILLLL